MLGDASGDAAAGKPGGRALAGMVSRVEQVHRAVAGRASGRLHEADAPARAIHDAASRSVYVAVRAVGAAAGAVGGQVASLFGAATAGPARLRAVTWRSPRSPWSTRWQAISSVPIWRRRPSGWQCGLEGATSAW